MRRHLSLLLLVPLTLLGCIVEAPSGADDDGAKKRPQRRAAVAPITNRLGANIGGKLELTSVVVEPGALIPGEAVRVSLKFRALEDLQTDYQVFVHVEDVDGRMERMNLDHWPNNGKTPTSEWKAGQEVSDDFFLMLPPGVPLRGLALWGGLWEPTSGERLVLRNPESVRNDGSNRILLVTIPVAR